MIKLHVGSSRDARSRVSRCEGDVGKLLDVLQFGFYFGELMNPLAKVAVRALSLVALTLISGRAMADGSSDDQLLRDATVLQIGLIGFAGHQSQEEEALYRILASPGARDRLTSLLNSATDVGKAYALCGLSSLKRNHAEARKYADSVVWQYPKINVMIGDRIVQEDVGFFTTRVAKGECRLTMSKTPR